MASALEMMELENAMSVSLSFQGIEPSAQLRLREIFNAHVQRLRGRLEMFSPDLVRLEGQMAKEPEQQKLHVSLRLKLPGGLLAAAGEGTDLKVVLSAFEELEQRLDRCLARRSFPNAVHAVAPRPSERLINRQQTR